MARSLIVFFFLLLLLSAQTRRMSKKKVGFKLFERDWGVTSAATTSSSNDTHTFYDSLINNPSFTASTITGTTTTITTTAPTTPPTPAPPAPILFELITEAATMKPSQKPKEEELILNEYAMRKSLLGPRDRRKHTNCLDLGDFCTRDEQCCFAYCQHRVLPSGARKSVCSIYEMDH